LLCSCSSIPLLFLFLFFFCKKKNPPRECHAVTQIIKSLWDCYCRSLKFYRRWPCVCATTQVELLIPPSLPSGHSHRLLHSVLKKEGKMGLWGSTQNHSSVALVMLYKMRLRSISPQTYSAISWRFKPGILLALDLASGEWVGKINRACHDIAPTANH
jgi:hypothetical protein